MYLVYVYMYILCICIYLVVGLFVYCMLFMCVVVILSELIVERGRRLCVRRMVQRGLSVAFSNGWSVAYSNIS